MYELIVGDGDSEVFCLRLTTLEAHGMLSDAVLQSVLASMEIEGEPVPHELIQRLFVSPAHLSRTL